MVLEGKRDDNFKKNRKSYGEINAWSKLVDRKNTEDLMKMLGLKETLDKMAQGNGARWYGHVVRRDEESILKKAMMLQENGQRKRGRPKQTWKRQVKESLKIGLRVEEATDRATWREE